MLNLKLVFIAVFAVFFVACANLQQDDKAKANAELEKLLKQYKTQCEKNNAKSCLEVGYQLYLDGINPLDDDTDARLEKLSQAKKYYLKSCNLNHGDGCAGYANALIYETLAKFHAENQNINIDKFTKKAKEKLTSQLKTMAKYANKACSLNSPAGCDMLGAMYFSGEGVGKNRQLGFSYKKKACDLLKSKDEYFSGKVGEDSCLYLGNSYYIGRDVAINKQMALQYYLKGCKFGLNCGLRVENFYYGYKDANINIPQDHDFAFRLAKVGCENDDIINCDSLGVFYANGIGTAKDESKAFAAFYKVCHTGKFFIPLDGNVSAMSALASKKLKTKSNGCRNLAIAYANGIGTAQSYPKALEIYENLCEEDHSEACSEAGRYYFEALGTRQDYKVAVFYFGKACDLGEQSGCDNHKKMKQFPSLYGLSKSDFE